MVRQAILVMLAALAILALSNVGSPTNAVGVSDNGTALLANGTVVRYSYSTVGVMGVLTFYNGSYTSLGFTGGDAFSAQLNVVVTNGVYYYWVQDIAHVQPFNDGLFIVWFWDDLWNVSAVNALLRVDLINGSRKYPGYVHYVAYYRYAAPPIMTTKAPLTVGCMVKVRLVGGFINIEYYYMLNSSTINTGWVRYDSVTVKDPSREAYIIVGGFNPGNLSNDIEWVVAGYTAAAQLYVFSWNATMELKYLYNGSWYTPPGGQSRSFDTGESVNVRHGICERYVDGIIVQANCPVNNTYLWAISFNATAVGGELEIYTEPAGGLWVVNVTGPGEALVLKPSAGVTRLNAYRPGRYLIEATLYAGNKPIYSREVEVYVSEPQLGALTLGMASEALLAAALISSIWLARNKVLNPKKTKQQAP